MPKRVFAKVSLIEGMKFQGTNEKGLGVLMDSAPAGEPAAGPSPMELLLQAAGGCTAMDLAFILRKKRHKPEMVEILVEGDKRDEHPRIFTHIRLTYRAKGPGVTIEELKKAAALTFETYCSVLAMLKLAAEVTYKCELIE